MRKIVFAVLAMFTPVLAKANKELNREASNPSNSTNGDTLRTQNDPHTTIGRLGAAVDRTVAFARNAATAFTSLRRQSAPALVMAAA